jgi:hypothetical protein
MTFVVAERKWVAANNAGLGVSEGQKGGGCRKLTYVLRPPRFFPERQERFQQPTEDRLRDHAEAEGRDRRQATEGQNAGVLHGAGRY